MSDKVNDRVRKVKSILVTQEAPTDPNSPYLKLAEKFNLKIDFRPFIEVQAVPVRNFVSRKLRSLSTPRLSSQAVMP
jgi:uroporphyrinogen-III synthase